MSRTSRPRALFVTYGGGHVTMVLPVIRELERLIPGIDCVLMALTTGFKRASAVRPTVGYRDFLHLVDAQRARREGVRLSPGNTSPDVPEDETIAYLGINYLDLVAEHGEAGAAELFREQGRYAFMPHRFMRAVLGELAPDVVIATNSPRSEQAVMEAASQMGIPNVGMVDLFGQEGDPFYKRSARPDRTCVMAELVRQRLLARGFEADRVVVTGNPAFDGLFSSDNQALAGRFLDDMKWHGLSPILWTGHIEPVSGPAGGRTAYSFPLEIEQTLRDCVHERDDLALIVRYHPSQWHDFPRLPAQPRVHFSIPPQEPIHPLILACGVVVVQNSTVGLESAVAGKPVVSLEHAPSVVESFSLADLGVSVPCHANDALPGLIEQALAGKLPRPASFSSDGQAARRVAHVISEVLA